THLYLHSFPTRRSSDLVYYSYYSKVIEANEVMEVMKAMSFITIFTTITLITFLYFIFVLVVYKAFRSTKLPIKNKKSSQVVLNIDRKSTRLNSSHVKIS